MKISWSPSAVHPSDDDHTRSLLDEASRARAAAQALSQSGMQQASLAFWTVSAEALAEAAARVTCASRRADLLRAGAAVAFRRRQVGEAFLLCAEAVRTTAWAKGQPMPAALGRLVQTRRPPVRKKKRSVVRLRLKGFARRPLTAFHARAWIRAALIPYPIPEDEPARLETLADCDLLDTPEEEPFADITRLAAILCNTPTAAISLVDVDRQWFKARVGIELASTSRQTAFCAHALEVSDVMVVEDARSDPRFVDNPLVTGQAGFRFYAGVPLRVGTGSALGTLCVLDRVPRTLEPKQIEGLVALARHVSHELRLRRAARVSRPTAASPWQPLCEGDIVGDGWIVGRSLGAGAVGLVFEAHRAGRRAAIKVLLPSWVANEEVVARFVREARILASLKSPHIGRILDVGNLDEDHHQVPFLVLEYLHGIDLERVLEARGRIPWREAVGWTVEACAGLTEAHGLGIVHRDLKPSNVLLSDDGNGATVLKLLDFGIAKTDQSPTVAPITQVGSVLGSVHYMSPEQMLGKQDIDARSDLWALGALLHELICGRPPFRGDSYLEICGAVLTRPPLPLRASVPAVPPALDAAVRRCLSRERTDRFDSAAALAATLTAIAAEA